jgi:soluble lytic murein transglycosylase
MQAPTPPALATLAAAVHAGRWAEVRTIGETFPAPVPPAVALALARAQRASGDEVRALAGLAAAIPNAGELAPALRVEAAQVALAVGRDPTPWLAPLLGRSTPTSLRHTAERTLRQAWQELPLALARHARPAHLARALRREMALTLAVREHDTTAALQALAEEGADQAALRAAVSLAAQPDLPTAGRISVAGALLGGGEWRRAHALLAAIGPPADRALHERWAFLSGRAAYRLGELSEAAAHFADAWSTAATSQERFAAAVQRARVAELRDDDAAALGFWDAARRSAPREVEGWDGGARSRAALGRFAAAVALLHHAPRAALHVAGPRLAALLLARGQTQRATALLRTLPARSGPAQLLRVAARLQAGEVDRAKAEARALLADPRAGAWRGLVLDLLPRAAPRAGTADAAADLPTLAALTVARGAEAARAAFGRALAADPAWAPLLGGEVPDPGGWTGPARALVEVGLEGDAAALFPQAFPAGAPTELAWSAVHLAAWGNLPAALSAGERLWTALGAVPAALVPAALLPCVLPDALVGRCATSVTGYDFPPSWLVAIVRQESRFDPGAASSAGALGVAQFMPEIARHLGADRASLADPEASYRLAAGEVDRLVHRFGPRLAIVAAAYNAGDAVVASWLQVLGSGVSDPLFIAAIPYGETAQYALAVRQGAELARHVDRPDPGGHGGGDAEGGGTSVGSGCGA